MSSPDDADVLLEAVRHFLEKYDYNMPLGARCLDLSSEVGELCKEWLVATDYATKEFEITERWQDEFGDVVFCVLSIAVTTGCDLRSTLESALEKYRVRIETKKN